MRAVEAIAGDAPRAPFDVFPHAEGVPLYREGDIALLFLERTSRRPEFASLAGRFPFFTIQERGQEWKLMDRDAMAVRAAARAYQDLRSNRTADGRAALRTLLLRNLRSEVPALRADAVAELLRARGLPDFFPGPEALAPFTALVGRESELPLTTRVALARTLDGVQGFDADAAVRAMTTETLDREERLALVRVAGNVRDPAVSLWLSRRLGSADATERREAAYALAHPWHAARWPVLSVRARGSGSERGPRGAARPRRRSGAPKPSPCCGASPARSRPSSSGSQPPSCAAPRRARPSPPGTLCNVPDTSSSPEPLPNTRRSFGLNCAIRRSGSLALGLAFALLLASAAPAAAVDLDFDDLASLSDVASAVLPGVSVSTALVLSEADAASLTGFSTAGTWATSGANGLLNTLAAKITLTFSQPVTDFAIDILSIEKDGVTLQILLSGSDGTSVLSDTTQIGNSGFHEQRLSLSGLFTSVELGAVFPCAAPLPCFSGETTTFWVDSASFTPVPEPGTLMLLGAGLGLLARSRRSRRA